MDWRLAIKEEQAALKRIVALLLALANLAELAGRRSLAVRCFVLMVLRPAENAARNFVMGGPEMPASVPVGPAGGSLAEAARLARNFRDLACELDRQATLAFAVYENDIGQTGTAPFALRRALRVGGVLNLTNALAFLTSASNTLRLTALPDTS
jgi:hypothetical protein